MYPDNKEARFLLGKVYLETEDAVGAEKELHLVLTVEEPELSFQRIEELGLIVSTHKILYSGGCVDITNDVIANLDEETLAGN